MNEAEFYHCTALLLSRLKYAINIEHATLKSGDEDELKQREWLNLAIGGLEIVTGTELPWYRRNVMFELDLTEEEQEKLKNDWHNLIRDCSLAGLRYTNGNPIAFGVKLADLEDPNSLVKLFERTNNEFTAFSENHRLAIAKNELSVFTLCFIYTNSENFISAKPVIENIKCKGSFWKGTHTIAWLLDLNTLELVSTKGFTTSNIEMMNTLASSLATSKDIKSIEEWNPPSKLVTSGIIGQKTFLNFAHLFLKTLAHYRNEVPENMGDQDIKHMSLEAELKSINVRIEEKFLRLGEILLQKFQAVEIFQEAYAYLQKAVEKNTLLKNYRSKLKTLQKLRQEFADSNNRLVQLEIDLVAIEDEFNENSSQMGDSMFDHEKEFIKQDEELASIYASPICLQAEINKRKLQIRDLEAQQKGILGSVTANTQILYLKGLNQKDYWSIRQHCRDAGVKVLEHLNTIPASSPVFPVWDRLKHIHGQRESQKEAIQQETQFEATVEEHVRGLEDVHQDGAYPWNELESFFREKTERVHSLLSEQLVSAGREAWRTGAAIGTVSLEVENAISQLEEDRKSLTRQLKEIDPED